MRAPYDDPTLNGLFISEAEFAIARTEFSCYFTRLMLNRMMVSYYKYGKVEDAMTPSETECKSTIDAIASAQVRIKKYLDTGNVEWLVDAANFMMMEFMFPSHVSAHFKATDADESPGRVEASSGESVQFSNRDLL